LNPVGGFMPCFSFCAMLAAFIYGMFLYKKPISLPRMLVAKFIVAVVCNIILGTYLLSTINGKGFIALLPGRVISNLVQWPVDSLIFYTVAKTLEKANVFKLIKPAKRR
ncbi:MAG: folate family ECF transporter S component, partial [Lachnospiraceae bacterium]|nr:folate family ECF transporter S component [Lachnospiraceae bacterium]